MAIAKGDGQFSPMRNLTESARVLRDLLSQRILVLDGAMGTMLQQRNLTAEDFGGAALEGCNENLVRTRPDVVLDIHRKYFAAGSDIVETNSFGGAPIVLAEYGLAAAAHFLNRRSAELARQAADEFSTSAKPRFVAGSWAPPPRPSPSPAVSPSRSSAKPTTSKPKACSRAAPTSSSSKPVKTRATSKPLCWPSRNFPAKSA